MGTAGVVAQVVNGLPTFKCRSGVVVDSRSNRVVQKRKDRYHAVTMTTPHLALAHQLALLFAPLPQVTAVALGGSLGAGAADAASDIDLYVYTRVAIPLEERHAIVERAGGATRKDVGLEYWGPGDEWIHAPTGIEVDIVYFDVGWAEEEITRVMERHQASAGYTTCYCYTVRLSHIFHDPGGWLAAQQKRCLGDYPEALRRNIIALNHPVLRGVIPSYAFQLEKAAKRRDLVSINHRLAALLASYFDILFALNRQFHPGEKRLLLHVLSRCPQLPARLEGELTTLLQTATAEPAALPGQVAQLLDHLDELLQTEGFAIARTAR